MSETLVTQSEKYLKKIQSKPILAESIEDFDSFIEIFIYLKKNLETLQNLRNKMAAIENEALVEVDELAGEILCLVRHAGLYAPTEERQGQSRGESSAEEEHVVIPVLMSCHRLWAGVFAHTVPGGHRRAVAAS